MAKRLDEGFAQLSILHNVVETSSKFRNGEIDENDYNQTMCDLIFPGKRVKRVENPGTWEEAFMHGWSFEEDEDDEELNG